MSLLSRRGEKKINTYENTEGGLGTARKQKKKETRLRMEKLKEKREWPER